MYLDNFYNISNNQISFSRQQASRFAKEIADDFNPLHNIDAKRFCVPGDLLFSLVLARSGLHQTMNFTFSGMVTEDVPLTFPNNISTQASIIDKNQKEYLMVKANGEQTRNSKTIEALTKAYVGFSGQTFPHILVELMKEHQVMINPARPMIMYESMSIHLNDINFEQVSLTLSSTSLNIEGKRGNARLAFHLLSDGVQVGYGEKLMILSGLRAYCQDSIDNIIKQYNETKATYHNQSSG